MCSLFAMCSQIPQHATFSLLEAPRSLLKQSYANADGWGMAFHQENGRAPESADPVEHARSLNLSAYVKEPVAAHTSQWFMHGAQAVRTRALIVHLRHKTIGDRSEANTQPFGGFVALAHNGGLGGRWHRRLRAAIADPELQPRGATSGELLWGWLEQLIRTRFTPWNDDTQAFERAVIDELLRPMLVEPDGIRSANFVMGHGETLHAFRFAPKSHNKLYFLSRRRSVLVSSIPLSDEAWHELPNGSLLTAKGARYRITRVTRAYDTG